MTARLALTAQAEDLIDAYTAELAAAGASVVAVGTALTGGPPHRSQRAGLPHWAPTSGAGVEAHAGPGMRDADGG